MPEALKKRLEEQQELFSYEFREIFKNNLFFIEHLWWLLLIQGDCGKLYTMMSHNVIVNFAILLRMKEISIGLLGIKKS